MALRMDNSSSNSVKSIGNKKIDGKKLSVLIVDDDPVIRRIHSVMLNKFGFETHVVENGKEVVDLYRDGVYFNLVLMDMEMPIMDGPKATQELRGMGVDSIIVGVTSRGLDSEKQAFMRAGLNDCFVKPLNADTISSLLQQLIKNH